MLIPLDIPYLQNWINYSIINYYTICLHGFRHMNISQSSRWIKKSVYIQNRLGVEFFSHVSIYYSKEEMVFVIRDKVCDWKSESYLCVMNILTHNCISLAISLNMQCLKNETTWQPASPVSSYQIMYVYIEYR